MLELTRSFLKVTSSFNKDDKSHHKTSIKVLRDPLRSTREYCVVVWKKSVGVNCIRPRDKCMQLGKILYYFLIICELFNSRETVHGFFYT